MTKGWVFYVAVMASAAVGTYLGYVSAYDAYMRLKGERSAK